MQALLWLFGGGGFDSRIDGVLCKQVVCPGNDKIALEMNDVAEYLRALLNNVNLHRLYPERRDLGCVKSGLKS